MDSCVSKKRASVALSTRGHWFGPSLVPAGYTSSHLWPIHPLQPTLDLDVLPSRGEAPSFGLHGTAGSGAGPAAPFFCPPQTSLGNPTRVNLGDRSQSVLLAAKLVQHPQIQSAVLLVLSRCASRQSANQRRTHLVFWGVGCRFEELA